jgi:N-carbamoyl-L-amino-acid hydrolase
MNAPSLAINLNRLMGEIEQLSHFSDAPAPAVTRILYTPADLAARAYLCELAAAAGLSWRVDAMGNTFLRWEGRDRELSAVATGSHIDAVPFSGKYDGVVGVLGALEAVRALQASSFQPQRSVEIILFTAEEPTRFGLGCIGSRALAGVIDPASLLTLCDSEGLAFDAVRQAAGFGGQLEDVRLAPGHYAAFVELHIEQGLELEVSGVPIGVVTGIAASTTAFVSFHGEGGHAGTVLMGLRHDPLPAASQLALTVEAAARAHPAGDAVATVGIFEVHPGASNSIPTSVRISIDVRNQEMTVRDGLLHRFQTEAKQIAAHRGLIHEFQIVNSDHALHCDPRIVAIAVAAAGAVGLPYKHLVSRAYHDTVFMGHICPVGMIFVPSRGGYSHRPEEYTTPEEIGQGVQVLALTLAELAQ